MVGIRFCQHIFRSSTLLRTFINSTSKTSHQPRPLSWQKNVGQYWRLLPYPFLTLGALRVKCEEGSSWKFEESCSPQPLRFVCPGSEPESSKPKCQHSPKPCTSPERCFKIDLLGLDEGVVDLSTSEPGEKATPYCDEPVNSTTNVKGNVGKLNMSEEDKFSSIFGIQAAAAEEAQRSFEPEELTHKFLLKQACSVNVDSVTRVITETMSALEDYHSMYREMLKQLMSNLEESRGASERHQEMLTCRMIVLRSQIEDMRANIAELESYLYSVERLAHATAESAFLAHAEYPSIALSERIQSALAEASRIASVTKDMERDMIQLQTLVIVESGNSLK